MIGLENDINDDNVSWQRKNNEDGNSPIYDTVGEIDLPLLKVERFVFNALWRAIQNPLEESLIRATLLDGNWINVGWW